MVRAVRRSPNVRAYTDANGVTPGTIMAVIIRAQTAANASKPRPIVPGMEPMPRPTTTTASQATTASASNAGVAGVRFASTRSSAMFPRSCRRVTRTHVRPGEREARFVVAACESHGSAGCEIAQEVECGAVLRKDPRHERVESPVGREHREAASESTPQTAALPGVLDRDRDLGIVSAR